MKLNLGFILFVGKIKYLPEKPRIYAESTLRGLRFTDPCIAKSAFFVKMDSERMKTQQ